MMKNIKNKRGEGYIDLCVGVVVFVIMLVVAINVFSFVTLRIEMEQIADEMLQTATETGEFGSEYRETENILKERYFDFEASEKAERYHNISYKRVQLGERMEVTVTVHTKVNGVGVFSIPVTLNVKKSGLSEKYWK